MARKTKTASVPVVTPPPFSTKPRRYKPLLLNILYLAANHMPPEKIAATVSQSLKRVQWILSSARGSQEVAKLAFKMSGQNPQRAFAALMPEAVQMHAEVMRNPAVKHSTRLQAAMAISDRVMGKPKETVDINKKSTVRVLLEQLQAERDPSLLPPLEAEFEDLGDAEIRIKEIQSDSAPAADSIDEWIAENL